jgi:hypothetical protein
MANFHGPSAVLDADPKPATAPLIVLFERDDAIAVPLLSQLRLAGYDVRASRTPVELFDVLGKHLASLVLVDLGNATAGRREFWVALDAQRRGRAIQVMTFRYVQPGGLFDIEIETPARALADVEVHGAHEFQLVLDGVRQRVPLHGGSWPGAQGASPFDASSGAIPPIGAALGVPSPFAQVPAAAYGASPFEGNGFGGVPGYPPMNGSAGNSPAAGRPMPPIYPYPPPAFGQPVPGSPDFQPSFMIPGTPHNGFSPPPYAPPSPAAPFTPPPAQAWPFPPPGTDAAAFAPQGAGPVTPYPDAGSAWGAGAPASPFANPAASNPFAREAEQSPFAQPYDLNPFARDVSGSHPQPEAGTPFPAPERPSPAPAWPEPPAGFGTHTPADGMWGGAGNGFASGFARNGNGHAAPGHAFELGAAGLDGPAGFSAGFAAGNGHLSGAAGQSTPNGRMGAPISDVWQPPESDFDQETGVIPEMANAPFEPSPARGDFPWDRSEPGIGQAPRGDTRHQETMPVPAPSRLPAVRPRTETEKALGNVLVEGALLTPSRLDVLKGIQQMLGSVDMHFKLGELALLFKFLSPDQLLAALLVSRGLVSPQQIAGLGRVKQELAASGMDYDLEMLLVMFHIMQPEQLRQLRAELG